MRPSGRYAPLVGLIGTLYADCVTRATTMLKKVFWILLTIAILGYLANNYLENRAKEEAKRVATLEKKNAIKAAVAKMATSTNAKDDWDEKLSKGEMYRLANILSVELEE